MSRSLDTKFSFARKGWELIDDAAVHDLDGYGLQVLQDTIISSITLNTAAYSGTLTGITLIAGLFIPVEFTSITLTSGIVLALRN